LATIRKLAYIVVAAFFVLVAALFAYGNPDPITIDMALRASRTCP